MEAGRQELLKAKGAARPQHDGCMALSAQPSSWWSRWFRWRIANSAYPPFELNLRLSLGHAHAACGAPRRRMSRCTTHWSGCVASSRLRPPRWAACRCVQRPCSACYAWRLTPWAFGQPASHRPGHAGMAQRCWSLLPSPLLSSFAILQEYYPPQATASLTF